MSGVSMNTMKQPTPSLSQHPTAAGKAVKSSFYWAMRFMPSERREAMYVVYAFCREVDDIADGNDSVENKLVRLARWREAIDQIYTDAKPDHEMANLKLVVNQYGLNKADLIAVIDGMEMDANTTVRIADEDTFDLYIDRVACAVGRLSDKVFGVTGPDAEKLAHHLGRGLQITNILRDLDEDAERSRLYLPLSMLQDAGIETDKLEDVLTHPNLHTVLEMLAIRAHDHFGKARDALSRLDKTKTRPARMMMAVYERVLKRLEARGLANTQTSVALPKWMKLWLAVRHGLF
ncbi:MAG: presqualene diphosphate synthase HpnD [Magnetovibrio sp.]|nr:presqualene diphosphate synthase HpnD [Magnetovibrio sp.]